jgi:hypothetical protein
MLISCSLVSSEPDDVPQSDTPAQALMPLASLEVYAALVDQPPDVLYVE